MNWDDLRFVLAVSRSGSARSAASVLGVDHSTVSRRLRVLEQALGVRLFDRRADGYSATPAGEQIFENAVRIEDEIATIRRAVLGRDRQLSGVVRLTAPDLIILMLASEFTAFTRMYPGIELQLISGNEFANIYRGEVDVALRMTRSPPELLVGRRVARLHASVYGPADFEPRSKSGDLTEESWIGWDESMALIPSARWMREHIPARCIRCRVSSSLSIRELIRKGMGIGHQICEFGDEDATLRRLMPINPELSIDLWLLTHKDLRTTARIRALLEFLAEALKKRFSVGDTEPRAGSAPFPP